jgi:outer membrane protein OmpA-like peptidoglycan-associated protein
MNTEPAWYLSFSGSRVGCGLFGFARDTRAATVLGLASIICLSQITVRAVEESPSATPTETIPSATAISAESPSESPGPVEEPSLVSLSSGAFPIKRPSEYSGAYSTIQLLDERLSTNWTSTEGNLGPEVCVIALPEKTMLKTVEFDCAGTEDSCAHDVSVEMSDKGQNDGYEKIADVSLKPGANNQKFPVTAEIPGRWVRLTIKNNHGSKRFIELGEFRGYGTQLTQTPFPNVSGTYDSDLGAMHLKQEGASVIGCYYTRGGVFEGGIEGRVMKLTWCDLCNTSKQKRGPAILVFAPDAERFVGIWWDEGATSGHGSGWDGTKKGSDVGSCPQWASAPKGVSPAEQQMTKDLEDLGRARVYGINFDSDSDKIKEESKPTLDNIVAMLKAKADWRLSIEGHTDSTSTPQHNKGLSERRAASVKNYLTTAGIDASHLSTVGYGQDKPVAPNDSPIGRAQNRRVELTKQ